MVEQTKKTHISRWKIPAGWRCFWSDYWKQIVILPEIVLGCYWMRMVILQVYIWHRYSYFLSIFYCCQGSYPTLIRAPRKGYLFGLASCQLPRISRTQAWDASACVGTSRHWVLYLHFSSVDFYFSSSFSSVCASILDSYIHSNSSLTIAGLFASRAKQTIHHIHIHLYLLNS